MEEESIQKTSLNATAVPSMLHPHSNDNLLKIDTYDTYSTVNLIKKKIVKDLNLSLGAENSSATVAAPATDGELPHAASASSTTRPGALFPGQLRMHKNPKNSYLYLAFDTPENRMAALQQLITVPGRKGVPWREAPVVPHDLAVTYKGESTRKRERGRSVGDGLTTTANASSSSSSPITHPTSGTNGIKVAGFAHLSKAQQLDRKTSHCLKVMKRILPANVYGWDTYIKRFDGVRESPQWKGYRNHVHLSFGNTKEGVPSVGFWAGAMVDGFHYIISAIPNEDPSESATESSSTAPAPLPQPSSHEVEGHTFQRRKEDEVRKVVEGREVEGEKNDLGKHVEVAKKKETEEEEKERKSHAVSSATAVLPPCCHPTGVEQEVGEAEGNDSEEAVVVTMHPIAREIAAAVMGVAREFFTPSAPPTIAETEERRAFGASPSSPLPKKRRRALQVFDKRTGEGFWRKLQIRHNTVGEVMVDLEWGAEVGSPDASQEDQELFHDVQQRVVQVLMGVALQQRLTAVFDPSASISSGHHHDTVDERNGMTSAVVPSSLSSSSSSSSSITPRVVSIHYHLHSGIGSTPMDAPRHVLAGESQLIEYVRMEGQPCLSFAIGPTTFFQVNTPALSVMLDALVRLGEFDPRRTTLLDLCSGVGTLGMCLASRVRRVIGIELVEQSVLHARENGKRNGLQNVVYHCGRVESELPRVMSGLSADEKEDVVVILDPPRAGVNSTVLKWVRGAPTIRTVIYISCEQKALELNCPFFTKPPTKAYRGEAFEVMKGFGVDMFPHTPHVEMIVMLRRSKPNNEGVQKEHGRVEEEKAEKEEGVGNEEGDGTKE